MRRILTAAALAVVATAPMLLVASAASAADPAPSIEAHADKVSLGTNPWRPTGELTVSVVNGGAQAAKGYFVLYLPESVKPTPSQHCVPADGPIQPTWYCGGAVIPAGGSRTYELQVASATDEPVFQTQIEGWVEGKSEGGQHGSRRTFTIAWPDRLPLRLAATAGQPVDGHVEVAVRVTNAGTFTLGGYSLNVKTPAGVRVVAPACTDSGRMNGVGCEVYRGGRLNAGATDSFTVSLATGPTSTTVDLWLAPDNRYTNRDTSVSLQIGGPPASATTPAGASPTVGAPGPTDAATLPVTGFWTGPTVGLGVALLLLGAGLLRASRRAGRRAGLARS